MTEAAVTRVFALGGVAVARAAPPRPAARPAGRAAPPRPPGRAGRLARTVARTVEGVRYVTELRYDDAGRLVALRPPGSSAWLRYRYDTAGWPSAVSAGGRLHAELRRTATGASLAFGNGVVGAHHAGPGGLAAIRVTGRDGTVLELEYGYDKAGRITRCGADRFGYDERGRLAWADGGNRRTVFDHDTGPRPELAHDAAGRRVADGGAGSTRYRYDADGRLTRVERDGRRLADYGYDGDGRTAFRRTATTMAVYHYDPWGRLLAETDERGRALATHVWLGPAEVARVLGPLESGAVHYLHRDHLGSLRALTDAAGRVAWSGRHQPFGEPSGDEPPGGHRFMGHRHDAVTGLYDFGARWYDPRTARFLTPDPYTGGPDDPRLAGAGGRAATAQMARWRAGGQLDDPYALCGGNPVCYVDPDGRWAVGWVLLNIVVGTLWALPWTVLGLCVAVLNLVLQLFNLLLNLFGTGWQGLVFDADACGALDTYGVFFGGGLLGTLLAALGIDAITMGNVIWRAENPVLGIPALNRHELRHTNQYEWLGPFFHVGLPVWGFYWWDVMVNGYFGAVTETDARTWETKTC